MNLTNIALTIQPAGNAYVEGVSGGDKYHQWLDPQTLRPIDTTVYKKPASRAGRMGPGRVIHLSSTKGSGAEASRILLAKVPELADTARAGAAAARKLAQEKQAEKQAEKRAEEYARAAGPQLLAAARQALAAPAHDNQAIAAAYAALAEAVAAATPPPDWTV